MIFIILFVFAGIIRLIEGSSDTKIPHWLLNLLFFVVPFIGITIESDVTVFDAYDWFSVVWCTSFCALCLIVGHTDWNDWLWQPMRFAMFGFTAVYFISDRYLAVPVAFAIAGLMYPILMKVNLPKFWLFDGSEAYARFFAGAVCLNPVIWMVVW